jgi:hypothetical protein
MNRPTHADSLETLISRFPATPGKGPREYALETAQRRVIRRAYGSTTRRQFKGPGPDVLLAPGAAVGLCQDGHVKHVRPYNCPQRFVGFHAVSINDETIQVHSAGTVRLFIHGAEHAKVGQSVFVEDADRFSIEPREGGLKIGIIRSREESHPGCFLVTFNDANNFEDSSKAHINF